MSKTIWTVKFEKDINSFWSTKELAEQHVKFLVNKYGDADWEIFEHPVDVNEYGK